MGGASIKTAKGLAGEDTGDSAIQLGRDDDNSEGDCIRGKKRLLVPSDTCHVGEDLILNTEDEGPTDERKRQRVTPIVEVARKQSKKQRRDLRNTAKMTCLAEVILSDVFLGNMLSS
jgi:hypothetical protein